MRRRIFLASIASLALTGQAGASVEITSAATSNMNCAAGVCTPTAKKAVLNATDLANMLASGDVTVKTGAGAVTITVSQSFSWTSANRLTLDAMKTVSFKAPVMVAGPGAVTITTDDGGSGGDLIFFSGASLSFLDLSSSLVVNGASYTLVNDIATLASDVAANPSGDYALAKDYDARPDGVYPSSPVGSDFSGSFEGLGHTISHLSISDTTINVNVGLFAKTVGGTLRDVTMHGAQMQGGGNAMGILVGYDDGNSTIDDVTVAGTLTSGVEVGGIAGFNYGTIMNSHAAVTISDGGVDVGGVAGDSVGSILDSDAAGSVTGGIWVGGLAGYSQTLISDSHSSAVVTATNTGETGGLVGYLNVGTIQRSYATGNVSNNFTAPQAPPHKETNHLGGLVGFSSGQIIQSHATGSVTANTLSGEKPSVAGGLVGFLTNPGSSIAQSYAIGNVQLDRGDAGGLVGVVSSASTVSRSFATGSARVSDKRQGFTGGFAGNNEGAIDEVYALGSSSSANAANGAAGGLVGENTGTIGQAYSTGVVVAPVLTGGSIGEDNAASGNLASLYWDLDTSGVSDPSKGAGNIANDPGITGLTTTQLQSGLPAGFDPSVWGESPSINSGLPYLLANTPPK